MRLCSEPVEVVPVCDLPDGHDGAHQATIIWGDERGDEDADS
jgi:hypothetical protein